PRERHPGRCVLVRSDRPDRVRARSVGPSQPRVWRIAPVYRSVRGFWGEYYEDGKRGKPTTAPTDSIVLVLNTRDEPIRARERLRCRCCILVAADVRAMQPFSARPADTCGSTSGSVGVARAAAFRDGDSISTR